MAEGGTTEDEEEFYETSEEISPSQVPSPKNAAQRGGADGSRAMNVEQRGGKQASTSGGGAARRAASGREPLSQKSRHGQAASTGRGGEGTDGGQSRPEVEENDTLERALGDGRLSPHLRVDDGGRADAREAAAASTTPAATDAPNNNNKTAHLRIVNLDTGEEFTLARENSAAASGAGPTASSPLPNIRNSKTGETCSLEEFERSLGLSPLMREMERRRGHAADGADESDEDSEDSDGRHSVASRASGSSGGGDRQAGATPARKPLNPGRWMKKRISERFGGATTATASGDDGIVSRNRGTSRDRATAPNGDTRVVAGADGIAGFSPDESAEGEAERLGNDNGGGGGDERRRGSHSLATTSGKVARTGEAVKVSVHRKVYKEFTELRHVQELKGHVGAVWCMRFSHCGRFLASAGQDTTVRIWQVLEAYGDEKGPGQRQGGGDGSEGKRNASSSSSSSSSSSTAAANSRGAAVSAGDGEVVGGDMGSASPYFHEEPHRTYVGHKADVLDLCWSKSQFLLSSSMDKSVRLWHISMEGCLRVFNHNDFVTAIDFNPVDDKFFLSGSLDEKLRIWNIPDHAVADWVDVHEMITSACYSTDGKQAIVGSYRGKCRFYNAEGARLEYVTQIEVRNTRGKNARGRKITGLQIMPDDPKKLLITSNDSRVRIFDGYNLRCKYKGLKNSNSQIRASFNSRGEYIICGSEDGSVYIWSTISTYIPAVNQTYTGFRRDKQPAFECFEAHDDIVTVAIFVPGSRLQRPVRAAAKSTKAAAAAVPLESLRTPDSIATAEGEVAIASTASLGQMIVTTGYGGEIKLWENVGRPSWL